MLFKKDDKDNFMIRRNMAIYSAIYSLAIWPHELLIMHFIFGLDIGLIKALLAYVGTVASGSIGGYIWSAMKDDNKNVDDVTKKS